MVPFPLPHCPEQPLARRRSDSQALLILGTDLLCQMLTQYRRSVCPKIVVEVPKPWLEHPYCNPDLGGSGGQPFRCALPGRIAVDGDVEAPQPFRQQDGSEVTR